jgi:hypothetical protein
MGGRGASCPSDKTFKELELASEASTLGASC